jgi:hypothetical protein
MYDATAPARHRPNLAGFPISQFWFLAHLTLWGVLFGAIYVVVPRLKMVLSDFGVDLPQVSILALQIVDFLAGSPFRILVTLGFVAAVDASILLTNDLRGPDHSRVWVLHWMIGVPLCLVLFLAWGLFLPLFTLASKLTG